MVETESEEDIEERSEEAPQSQTETLPPPSGPSGLVIFGRLVQKHSYVSALIIMMVKCTLIFIYEGFELVWQVL